jgi:diamine N-acetyltransferase
MLTSRNMRALVISHATSADLPIVQRIAYVTWHAHYPGILSAAQIEYMLARGYAIPALERFRREHGAGLAIARVDGAAAGFAAWHRHTPARTTKLDRLYVLPDMQRQGVGRALVAHAEARARDDGSTHLVLNVNKRNASSIAMYERCGFVREADVVADIGSGFVMDDYVMGKPIAGAARDLR